MQPDAADECLSETKAWRRHGITLYKNVLKALRDLATLSANLPSPGCGPIEVKFKENLRTALETINPEGFLKSHNKLGVEGGDLMRLRISLKRWVEDGQDETQKFLRKFQQSFLPIK